MTPPVLSCRSDMSSTGSSPKGFFAQGAHADTQPLDLRVHRLREEQPPDRIRAGENKSISLIRTYASNFGSNHNQRHFPYCRSTKSGTSSPKPGILSSLLSCTDSPFKHRPRSTGCDICPSNIPAETSPDYISLESPPSTTMKNQSFQLSKTSQGLKLSPGPSDSLTSFHESSDSGIAIRSTNEVYNQQPPTMQQECLYDILLNSDTSKLLGDKSSNDRPASRLFLLNEKPTSKTPSGQHRKREDKVKPVNSPNQSTTRHKLVNKNCNFLEVKSETQFTVSHTYREKSKKKVAYTTNTQRVVNQQQQLHQQQQIFLPDSTSSADDILPKQSFHWNPRRLPLTSPSSMFQSQLHNSHKISSSVVENSIFSTSSETDPMSSCPSPEQSHTSQSSMKTHLERKISLGNTCQTFRDASLANSNDVLISTSAIDNRISGSSHKVNNEQRSIGFEDSISADLEIKDNSTKISLLDFWISKVLLERSADAPPSGRPRNVDYICSANGDKKIRLRLVDLIELQVEQSLKA